MSARAISRVTSDLSKSQSQANDSENTLAQSQSVLAKEVSSKDIKSEPLEVNQASVCASSPKLAFPQVKLIPKQSLQPQKAIHVCLKKVLKLAFLNLLISLVD